MACLVLLGGLATFQPWAREGALGIFGLGGSLLLIFSLGGVPQDPSAARAVQGLVASLAVLAVAVLVLTSGVRNDFEARRLQKACARGRRRPPRGARGPCEGAPAHVQVLGGRPSSDT